MIKYKILLLSFFLLFFTACQSLRQSIAGKGPSDKPETTQERMPSSYVSLYDCKAQKTVSAENEEEAKKFFVSYVNNGTVQPGSVKIRCQLAGETRAPAGASNICDTSVGTCFVNTAQPVGSPCGCAGYPGSIAPQK